MEKYVGFGEARR